jgi:hypothetical protein
MPKTDAPSHKATYASDKKKGGYLVRVAGPSAGKFVGREVPVTRMDDTESMEKLTKLIWSGIDTETGGNVALYAFEARPRDPAQEVVW